ncbi:MAG: thymidylate synthase [Dehalococcoidia bacterium]|nr:thymidylate synthase [Dehalococcoidia bacterium]
MQISMIEGRDLSEAFFHSCRKVLQEGYQYVIDKGSFEGAKRRELDFAVIHIKQPGNRPLVPDVPQGVPPPTSDNYINEYMSYLITDAIQPHEQYTYGQYLAPQIDTVIHRYKNDGPECNQLCMTVGGKESLDLEHPPCLRMVDTRIRYGKLHFIIYFRSWDLWAGFPTNLGGLQLLKEYMAGEIGVEDGEMICVSKGLHLYEYSWELAASVARINL